MTKRTYRSASTAETGLPALFPAREDQPLALEHAGFVDVLLCYEEGNMALWRGRNPEVPGGAASGRSLQARALLGGVT